jgi:hypothetical protein
MKHAFGSLLLITALTFSGCGGDESAANGTPAAAPGTEVPTQTTTVVIPLPEEGVTDTAAPGGTAAPPAGAPADTATAPASPAATPTS